MIREILACIIFAAVMSGMVYIMLSPGGM